MKLFPGYGHQILNLGGLPDELEAALYQEADPSNDGHLRHIIGKMIKPYFARWDDESQLHLQRVLAMALLKNDEAWLTNVWEADLPPFDLTDPPRRFFELLYEDLFGPVPYDEVIPNMDAVEYAGDPRECDRMRVPPSDAPDVPKDLLPLPD